MPVSGCGFGSTFWELEQQPTGTALTVVEFGAGDTSVGVFPRASLGPSAVISDGAIEACALFE